jgi:hypothetical protein
MFVQLLLKAYPNIAIIDELNIQQKLKRTDFIKQVHSKLIHYL